MNEQPDERTSSTSAVRWLNEQVMPTDELAVIIDGERAALVAFDRDGEPRFRALNIPVVTPPVGFLDALLVDYRGQRRGRPAVSA